MSLIELEQYVVLPEGNGRGLAGVDFALSRGDVCAVNTRFADDAALFLKALATLVVPEEGTYRFGGEVINLSSYLNTLPCKKRIGHIALDTALVSNRTIRENLLLMRYYDEDVLSIRLDDRTTEYCRRFDIYDKLDRKPGEVHSQDVLNAITVRELCKPSDVLLLNRPEDVMDHTKFDIFGEILEDMLPTGRSVVFFTSNGAFETAFANRKISISAGRLSETDQHLPSAG